MKPDPISIMISIALFFLVIHFIDKMWKSRK